MAHQCHAALSQGTDTRSVGLREAKMRAVLSPIGEKFVDKVIDPAEEKFEHMKASARSMCLHSAFLDKLDEKSLMLTACKTNPAHSIRGWQGIRRCIRR